MMRHLRRFAAALLGVLLLQVSLLGAGGVCAMAATTGAVAHHGGSVAASGVDVAGHDHHAQGVPERADVAPSEHAPTPRHDGGPTHCPASMGCAFDAAVSAPSAAPDDGIRFATGIATPEVVAPASVVGAPEPPPPRG